MTIYTEEEKRLAYVALGDISWSNVETFDDAEEILCAVEKVIYDHFVAEAEAKDKMLREMAENTPRLTRDQLMAELRAWNRSML